MLIICMLIISELITKSMQLYQHKVIFILVALLVYAPNQILTIECSSFCTYLYNGTNYSPMCSGYTAADCTKCDLQIFELTGTTCSVHNYYNQILFTQSLVDSSGTVLTGWTKNNANYNQPVFATSQRLFQFYKIVTPIASAAGGNNYIYQKFTAIPAHYQIRIRFFILRSSTATFTFNYYIDTLKFKYDYNIYPSNLSRSDIVSTSKFPHMASDVTIKFQTFFGSVNNEDVSIKQLLIFISPCTASCTACNSETNCQVCGLNSAAPPVQTYLFQGYCYDDCPQTLFQNTTTNKCNYCNHYCYNCDVNSTYCLQCKIEGRDQSFLLNNTCYHTCPSGFHQSFINHTCVCPVDGFYIDSTYYCQPCAPQCNSCTGSTRTTCINCTAGNYLVLGTNWCSNTCPADQYPNDFTRKCYACTPTCASCQNGPDECTGCYFATIMKYLFEGQCLYNCPAGYQNNNNTRLCQKCPPYYYSYNYTCVISCPQNYLQNNESKSCLPLSQTNYTIPLTIQTAYILIDGQTMAFKVSFSLGLSSLSKSWLYSQSYFLVKLIVNNNVSTIAVGVTVQSDSSVLLRFKMPQQINQKSSMILDFSMNLNNSLSIKYASRTNLFNTYDSPQFLSDYYKKSEKYNFNTIIIPLLICLAVFLMLKIRASYDLLIQQVRSFQIMGLSMFVAFPYPSQSYYLYQGLNYFNFDFLPNLYNWFVQPFENSLQADVLLGFNFFYGDMDFIRLIGSITMFTVLYGIMLWIVKNILEVTAPTFAFLLRLGMDLVQVKILFSIWNSLLYTIINASINNVYLFAVHLVSYVFVGLILYRYYKIYTLSPKKEVNYAFIYRAVVLLGLTIAVYNQIIVLILLMFLSAVFGVKSFSNLRQTNHQTQKYKFGIVFFFRDLIIAFMPLLTIMGISFLVFYKDQIQPKDMIIVFTVFAYTLLVLSLLVLVYLHYFYKARQKSLDAHVRSGSDPKWRHLQLFTRQQNNNTSQNMILEQSTVSNASYIKDQFYINQQIKQQNQRDEQDTQKQNQENSQNQPVSQKFQRMNKTQLLGFQGKRSSNLKIQATSYQDKVDLEDDIQFQKINLQQNKQINNNRKMRQTLRDKERIDMNTYLQQNMGRQ